MRMQHGLLMRQQQRRSDFVVCGTAMHQSSTTVRAPILYRYTHNLDARQVAALLLLERAQCTRLHAVHAVHGLPPAEQLARLQPRVAMALRTSVAVVSAFASTDMAPADQWLQYGRDAHVLSEASSDAGAEVSNGEVLTGNTLAGVQKQQQQQHLVGNRKQQQQQHLVGIAWAYGDASLVATVAAVLACSTLPGGGKGVALALLQQLCLQVRRKGGVTDVGTLAAPMQQPLFDACMFGPDPEGSTAMALPVYGTSVLLEDMYTPQHIARHLDLQQLEQRLHAWR